MKAIQDNQYKLSKTSDELANLTLDVFRVNEKIAALRLAVAFLFYIPKLSAV